MPQPGTIIVDKVTIPGGSSQSFEFDPSWGVNFFLTHAATVHNSGDLAAGSYSVSETVPTDWTLTNIVCLGATSSVIDIDSDSTFESADDFNAGDDTANISLAEGETITCTFTNTEEPGSIRIVKDTDPETNNIDFDFDIDNGLPDFDLEDDESRTFSNLDPDTYRVREIERDGWTLTNISCSGGSVDVDLGLERVRIFLEAGENITCRFNNVRDEDPTETPEPTETPTEIPPTSTNTPTPPTATPTLIAEVSPSRLPNTGQGGDAGDRMWLIGLIAIIAGGSIFVISRRLQNGA